MLYDQRTYTCRPGMVRKQLELYAAHGFKPQTRHLGQPLLHAMTEVGDVNCFVHIWAYDSVDDRAKKRAAMQADPEWQTYLKLSNEAGYITRQQNSLLVRSPFLPA